MEGGAGEAMKQRQRSHLYFLSPISVKTGHPSDLGINPGFKII